TPRAARPPSCRSRRRRRRAGPSGAAPRGPPSPPRSPALGPPSRATGTPPRGARATPVDVVGDPRACLALRVEVEELAGELAQVLPRARLEVVPRLPSQPGERGRAGVGADVARDLADLLVRDVDAVLAAEAEQQVVAGDAADLLRLEAEEPR